jgi:hypothetical protein
LSLEEVRRAIFIGDKLLTTPNVSEDDDRRILAEVSG